MTAAFLNVAQSFTQKMWVARPYDERQSLAMAQRFGLPDVLACGLSARGLTVETAEAFLTPRMRDLMPDPSRLKGMDEAVARVHEAIKNQEKIAIFGDYDVDGGTSSALLLRFFRALGIEPRLYIPDRLSEGYGPNPAALEKLAGEDVRVVICVDCGTTAHDALAAGKAAGLDCIVIDHHAAEPHLPPAVAVVNPNRLDDALAPTLGHLAAVGVTFLFIVAVNRALRQASFYTAEHPEPDLMQWLDLVALGTVCDVVSLTGLNRAFVAQGLKVMGQRRNAGIRALADAATLKGAMDTYAAGFVLGPRVNAGGRVGEASLGARLLSCDDPTAALLMAETLNRSNTIRREIEARVLQEAEALSFGDDAPLTFVASANWHPGVIGIVASRLKEKYHRPALVVALEHGVGKGSGRSIGAIDLGAAVIAARQSGLLIAGGGHKMAAGLTVAEDKIDALRAFLCERVAKQLEAEHFKPTLSIDGLVAASALNETFTDKLTALAPFGTGNPEPRFALADCKLVHTQIVGEKHLSFVAMQGGSRFRGIAFRAMENPLGPALMSLGSTPCHLVGHLRPDTWKADGSLQLLLDDAAAS